MVALSSDSGSTTIQRARHLRDLRKLRPWPTDRVPVCRREARREQRSAAHRKCPRRFREKLDPRQVKDQLSRRSPPRPNPTLRLAATASLRSVQEVDRPSIGVDRLWSGNAVRRSRNGRRSRRNTDHLRLLDASRTGLRPVHASGLISGTGLEACPTGTK